MSSDLPNNQLSIGIPAFNQGKFLASTIESLLNQEASPEEIVVSDNHSTDETATVIKHFGSRVRGIKPPSHLRTFEHWNFLVRSMHSQWFSLLSSDDEAKPNFCSKLVKGISQTKNAVLVRAGFDSIDAEGNLVKSNYFRRLERTTKFPDNFIEQLSGPQTSFAAFAVKKSAFDRVGGFPESFMFYGDWGLWLNLSPLGDFIYENEIISRYRSNYRPTDLSDRWLGGLQDDVYLFTKFIPGLALANNLDAASQILKASQRRFFASVHGLIPLGLSEQDRLRVADIIRPWASVNGCEGVLQSYVEDGICPKRPPLHFFLKSPLRRYKF